MKRLLLWYAITCFIHFANLEGQSKIPDIRLYAVSDGLSQSRVTSIIQDSRGFLWVGTLNGLNRFDGYDFVVYTHQPNDSNSLSNNRINAICEDNSGKIWVATNKGLNSIDLVTGKISVYLTNYLKSNSLSDDVVLDVYVDMEKNLWVKTAKSLDKFIPSSGTFKRFPHYYDQLNVNSAIVKYPMVEDTLKRFWVGTKDGLNIFDRDLQLFDRYLSLDFNVNSLSNNVILSLYPENDHMWVGTASGLNFFTPDKKEFKRIYVDKDNIVNSLNNRINAILIDKENVFWVGTSGGIFIYDQKKNIFSRPDQVHNYVYSIPAYTIYQDRSGIIWVGTHKGLLKISSVKRKFDLYAENTANGTSLDIGAIYAPNHQSIWFGSYRGGLNYLDRNSGKIKSFDLSKLGNDKYNFVRYIYNFNDREYLLGTENGIISFDPLKGRPENWCDETKAQGCDLISSYRINSIVESTDGIWIATNNGLYFYNLVLNKFVGYLNNPEDKTTLASNNVLCLLTDKNGKLWIGTDDGIDIFNTSSETFKHFPEKLNGTISFTPSAINCLQEDEDENIWVGTPSGLNKISLKDSTVRYISTKDGLSDNFIYAILVDSKKNVWVSTNRGIDLINTKNYNVRTFDKSDGLQDDEFNFNSAFKGLDGELFFGGISGINTIYPDSMQSNNYIPQAVITSLQIVSNKGEKIINNPSQSVILVPYGTRFFTINFASLDFTFPKKNNFAYKFYSDNEPDWSYIGTKHSKTFTNIKPGRYKFKLKCSNNDLVWNETGTTVIIDIASPIWLKTQAYYIYGFVFLVFLIGFFRYRTYSLRRTNRILKEKEIAALEIERQRELLAVKNKNITDSINYAKRIQFALMPSEKSTKRILPDSFVFHQPKDIVSGDFFWVNERENKVFVAAVDCTGHGVPGAFMSIIGFELFRKITHNQGIENPSQILTILKKEFEEIFKDVENFTVRDGMDIALCVIDKKNMLLEYSGAVNPIYLIRDDKITEIRGSRFSVGLDDALEQEQTFENKQIILLEDDVIYLFSDGYADQFGGPEGKKFKYRRFRHLLLTIHQYPMEEQQRLLQERIERWKGEHEQVDDILVIGFRPVFS